MSAQVAVAVVSWNTRALLERALESLRPEVSRGLAQVWVVDNGSTDGSREQVRERFGWVTLLEPGENLGFGRAVNLVAARTDSPWIASANADIALRPGALEALLDTGGLNPRAGALAPRLVLPGGSTQHSVYPFPTVGFTLLFNLGLHRLSRRLGDRLCLEGFWDPDRERVVDWAIGAFLLIRREAWDQTGGFMEDQWMYAEDLDLGWRLAKRGFETRYVPSAHVAHESAAATRQVWVDELTQRRMLSTYAWMHRRRGRVTGWLVAAINIVGAGIRWLFLVIAAAVRPSPRRRSRRDLMRAWIAHHRVGLDPDRGEHR